MICENCKELDADIKTKEKDGKTYEYLCLDCAVKIDPAKLMPMQRHLDLYRLCHMERSELFWSGKVMLFIKDLMIQLDLWEQL